MEGITKTKVNNTKDSNHARSLYRKDLIMYGVIQKHNLSK